MEQARPKVRAREESENCQDGLTEGEKEWAGERLGKWHQKIRKTHSPCLRTLASSLALARLNLLDKNWPGREKERSRKRTSSLPFSSECF